MKRGELVAEGCVNFPMHSTEYSWGNGRGLVVKLVVLNRVAETGEAPGLCTGAYVVDLLNEPLIGDDKRPQPEDKPAPLNDPEAIMAHLDEENRAHKEWIAFHYPRHDVENATVSDMLSIDYRACILLGSTGWAGYSPTKGAWHATFEDLTPEGQDLYRLMERLNPGCPVHLLTFLDT